MRNGGVRVNLRGGGKEDHRTWRGVPDSCWLSRKSPCGESAPSACCRPPCRRTHWATGAKRARGSFKYSNTIYIVDAQIYAGPCRRPHRSLHRGLLRRPIPHEQSVPRPGWTAVGVQRQAPSCSSGANGLRQTDRIPAGFRGLPGNGRQSQASA